MPASAIAAILLVAAAAVGARRSGDEAEVRFNRDVRPILADHCFQCHGPDGGTRRADLRLDVEQGAIARAIVPGDSAASRLVARITAVAPREQMPPPRLAKPLEPEEIVTLRRWIDQGARYEPHWSLQPPRQLEPPTPGAGWPSNEVDRFVLAALRDRGVEPSPRADPVTLVRRVHFDLTGLPPEPEVVEAFARNPDDASWEALVDQLLESVHCAERLTTWWLDLVRYADSDGYHGDNEREVSPYRDWVIRAFHDNVPFDRFTIEQLAGDLLPDAGLEAQVASGYNRLGRTTNEGGAQPKEYLAKYAADRVRNAATVWMGATLGCAECHDHKFDPYSSRDFYRFAAFFADVEEVAVARPGPAFPVPTPEQEIELARLDEVLAVKQAALAATGPEVEAAQAAWEASQQDIVPPTLGPWRSAGPFHASSFAEAFRTAFPPEPQADGDEEDDPDANVALAWVEQPGWIDGETVNLEGDNAATYVARSIHARDAQEIRLSLGSDDGIVVWWNGQQVLAREVLRGVAPDQERLTLTLLEGDNHLLLKIVNAGGGYAFHFRVEETGTPRAVLDLVKLAAADRTPEQAETVARHFRQVAPRFEGLRGEIAALEARRQEVREALTTTLVTRAVTPREMRVLPRGNFLDESGEVVTPGVPEFLGELPASGRRATRLDLARWLVSPRNPFAARVLVNRLWKLLFGHGLARTLDDLGAQGAWPTHPELLDWLAVEVVESGWDVRHVLRLLVTSATYRQTSWTSPELRARDPDNRWLARQSRFPLEAEMVRDNALAVSGLLVRSVGGRSVKPYQPKGYWGQLNFPVREYPSDSGEKSWRRGLYSHWQRTFLHPALVAFDAPSREESCVERVRSNTPQQALVLLNDPSFVEAARVFAVRILCEGGADDAAKLRFAFRRALSRRPSRHEVELLGGLLATHREHYAREPQAAADLVRVGSAPVAQDLDESDLAAWTSVARVLLNLHESITRD